MLGARLPRAKHLPLRSERRDSKLLGANMLQEESHNRHVTGSRGKSSQRPSRRSSRDDDLEGRRGDRVKGRRDDLLDSRGDDLLEVRRDG